MTYWEPPQRGTLVQALLVGEHFNGRLTDIKILGALKGDLIGEIVNDDEVRNGTVVRLRVKDGKGLRWVFDSVADWSW